MPYIKGTELTQVEFDQAMIALATNFIDTMPIVRDTPDLNEDERVGYFTASAMIYPDSELEHLTIKAAAGYIRRALLMRLVNLLMRECNCGSGLPSEELLDARGIYCGRVCDKCRAARKAEFRPDIFSDANYWADEPIEEEV